MSFLISDAWAEAAPAADQASPWGSFVLMGFVLVIFYVLMVLPQQKRAKELRKMLEALAKNDEVVTSGGLLGKVTDVDESFITLEIAAGVRVKLKKSAVASVVPKGTYKSS